MKEYCLGFLFTENLSEVLLIRRNKEPQKNTLNGIGGKIDPGERPDFAMVREFYEETGWSFSGWQYCGIIKGIDFRIHIYRGYQKEIPYGGEVTKEGVLEEWNIKYLIKSFIDGKVKLADDVELIIPLILSNRRIIDFEIEK